MNTALTDRIEGCLIGAIVGAELAFARAVNEKPWESIESPSDLFDIELEPALDWKPQPFNQWGASLRPLIELGARAYVKAGGRVTPELFGELFADDAGVATPAFAFDGLHTSQELIKEGMNPRLSGLNNAPCGLIAAAMPSVGIFHFADPDRAYLEGVELASVTQGRTGADWAGLCAAAVAAAFEPGATGQSVTDTVLRIARDNCRDVFYHVNERTRDPGQSQCDDDAAVAAWWSTVGSVIPLTHADNWVCPNPIRYALPLLARYHDQPVKLLQILAGASPTTGFSGWQEVHGHASAAVTAAAVVGALHGTSVFPKKWLAWARPMAEPSFELGTVVEERLQEEETLVAAVESLTREEANGASLLQDKIKGALLAGAIGNAMGSPVETKMYWEIDEQYPDGVTTILDPSRLETEDDNQMAMFLVETYVECEGRPASARHFGHTWHEQLNRNMFFPLCMGHTYDMIRKGMDPRTAGHWNVVTGSTVMCMEPVGMFNLADPVWAAQDATAISYMYQRGLDVVAAAMLAATVADALRADATVDSVLQAALDVASPSPLHTFDKRRFKSARDYIQVCLDVADKYDDVLAAREELYEKCLFYHCIDPLELWGLSLAMFKIARGDVRQASIGGTNIGRDSDTIAGRAAMLCGALKGTGGVPEEWLAMFSEKSITRIDHNAARLAELVGVKKLAHHRRRLTVAGKAEKSKD